MLSLFEKQLKTFIQKLRTVVPILKLIQFSFGNWKYAFIYLAISNYNRPPKLWNCESINFIFLYFFH